MALKLLRYFCPQNVVEAKNIKKRIKQICEGYAHWGVLNLLVQIQLLPQEVSKLVIAKSWVYREKFIPSISSV